MSNTAPDEPFTPPPSAEGESDLQATFQHTDEGWFFRISGPGCNEEFVGPYQDYEEAVISARARMTRLGRAAPLNG